MSTILKNFTPEQLYNLMRNKVIADNVGLTNFNPGSNTRSILEAVALVASAQGFDFLEATRQAIPISLYDGLGFRRKAATVSSGFLRFYRKPVFYITYTGADTDVELDISLTELTLTTSGTPADDVTVDFATFTTIDAVVAEIDSKTNWSATKVQDGSVSSLYLYSSRQIVGNENYLTLDDTVDVMSSTAPLVNILANAQASVDDVIIQTTSASTIAAGDATSPVIASTSLQTGEDANIDALAIDTESGNGTLNNPITGVEHVINDSAFANGTNKESDEERASRFQTFVQGLHGGTAAGIESAVLEITGIKSVTVRERFPAPGTNTVIADDGSGALTVAQIEEIRKVIDGDPDDLANYPGVGVAGINYNIEAPTVIAQDVVATVQRIGTISDSTEITTAVQSEIERYINTRKLGDDVVRSEIIKRAKSAHPAIYDFILTTPAANVSANLGEVIRTGAGTGASVALTLVTLTDTP